MTPRIPAIPWGTKRKDVTARQALVGKYIQKGHTRAEAERLMLLEIFRSHVRYYLNVKKIPLDRLICAVNEAIIEDVHDA
jgi:hypothetical protein